jgi:GH15 family glucan-1,4-alpha-glucosidase
MASRIEDYAVIGNCETVALVGRDGSIDWLCLPRFDSSAVFTSLLGTPENGRWLIAPADDGARVQRRYRGNTLILETTFETADGTVCLIDFMARGDGVAHVARIVRGTRGKVKMRTELVARFDYGSIVPWVSRRPDGRLRLTAGPDRLLLDTPVQLKGENMRTVGEFEVGVGQDLSFMLSWSPSYRPDPARETPQEMLSGVEAFWEEWASGFKPQGEWDAAVLRSLLTLKALAHFETGGIVAAGTTSLPEQLGGPRNWDYRFCWLRDATLTLYALVEAGFLEEARAWREWLLRAVAGDPGELQIMYGIAGERRLTEYEIPWLSGYEGSKPVHIGNAAHDQRQLDVYGEVLDALFVARQSGLPTDVPSWELERELMFHLETIWDQPDDGIWEVRGGRKQFTHSKVMAWVGFDRAIRSAENFGLEGPLDRWRLLRDHIHEEVCLSGFDVGQNSFVQSYGSTELDASLLMIPIVGFLPASDPRVTGTVAAIEHNLLRDGFVLRYDTGSGTDGLPPGEGAFLACSFWLADNYILQGRHHEARAMFERLLSLRNDVGLLAEEYDHHVKRQVGNFPQAFSHLALVNTARNLSSIGGPAHERSNRNGVSPKARQPDLPRC